MESQTTVERTLDRFDYLRGTFDTLNAILLSDAERDSLLARLQRIQRDLDSLDHEHDALRRPAPRSLTRELDELERALHEADAQVPMSEFRQCFQLATLTAKGVCRYARFLARVNAPSAMQFDRFEFVVTRLLSWGHVVAPFVLHPRERVASLLTYVVPASTVTLEDRVKPMVLSFFADAEKQLTSVTSIENVFSGGFYAEVRAYKATIRSHMFDHDVLYALASFNVALANRLHTLLDEQGVHQTELDGAIERYDREVDEVLEDVSSATLNRRFESARQRGQSEIAQLSEGDGYRTRRRTASSPRGRQYSPAPIAAASQNASGASRRPRVIAACIAAACIVAAFVYGFVLRS